VYKKDSGLQGKSVFIYDVERFPDASAPFGNGVFQRYVAQHEAFDVFGGQAVSTIRISTLVDDEGHVSCRAAYLRVPRISDKLVISASAIKIAINLSDGRLQDRGCLTDWSTVDRHPDTGAVFAGWTVPYFQKCVDTCIALHRKNPFPRTVGWDVIVDAQGNTAVMEWNGRHNDIKFSEAATGPCYADQGWENLWKDEVNA